MADASRFPPGNAADSIVLQATDPLASAPNAGTVFHDATMGVHDARTIEGIDQA